MRGSCPAGGGASARALTQGRPPRLHDGQCAAQTRERQQHGGRRPARRDHGHAAVLAPQSLVGLEDHAQPGRIHEADVAEIDDEGLDGLARRVVEHLAELIHRGDVEVTGGLDDGWFEHQRTRPYPDGVWSKLNVNQGIRRGPVRSRARAGARRHTASMRPTSHARIASGGRLSARRLGRGRRADRPNDRRALRASGGRPRRSPRAPELEPPRRMIYPPTRQRCRPDDPPHRHTADQATDTPDAYPKVSLHLGPWVARCRSRQGFVLSICICFTM